MMTREAAVMKRLTPLLALFVVLALAGLAEACPGCKNSIPNNDAEVVQGVPSGFNHSIYYMLAGLFTVGGLVIRMIVREVRSSDKPVPPR